MSFIFTPPAAVVPTNPGGADTNVQYNAAGVFAGYANFTYSSGTNTLGVGSVIGTALAMTVQPKIPTVLEDSGVLNIFTANAVKADSTAGTLNIRTGNGTGVGASGALMISTGSGAIGGLININGGSGTSGTGGVVALRGGDSNAQIPGSVSLTGGDSYSTFSGGAIDIIGGRGFGGPGGTVLIRGGRGSLTAGGLIELRGGVGTGVGNRGGSVLINPTRGTVSATDAGNVRINTGATTGVYGFAANSDNSTVGRIGFFGVDANADPIAQPTTAFASAAFVQNVSANIVYSASTFDGYTIPQIVAILRAFKLIA